MKFVTAILVVVFNLSLLLMYSSGLVGGGRAAEKSRAEAKPRTPVAERSASSPIEKAPQSKKPSERRGDGGDAKEVAERERPAGGTGEGKEVIDPKDGKETVEPVAENVSALRLGSGTGRRSTELFPRGRAEGRGILAPANPANVDPPVVSPEAR